MDSPVGWLERTFDSHEKTRQLLRPELESGLITEHDYQLAATFLPGPQRYWPITYTFLGNGLAFAYGRWGRRPPWPLSRTLLVSAFSGVAGYLYGEFRRFKAHMTFTKQLEDPAAFSQALQNVNSRMGGEPLTWTLAQAKQRRQVKAPTVDEHGDSPHPNEQGWAQGGNSPAAPSEVNKQNPGASKLNPLSRWEELRAANARSAAKNSTWDALRQSHERERFLDNMQSSERDTLQADEARAREQAQFDAMLEAERKRSSG